MALTAIGADTVTSISRHYILPELTDIVYDAIPLLFRLNKAKKIIPGGTQLEAPIITSRMAAGGTYRGSQVLSMVPSDTIQNAVWDWKQYYVPVVIDGLTMLKVDSPLAIANLIRIQFEQAEMDMSTNLAIGLFSDGSTDPNAIDGLQLAVDSTGTYGGVSRSAISAWGAQEDASTSTLSLTALNSMHGNTRKGGRSASVIVSRQEQYNRYWKLAMDKANIFLEPTRVDSKMADLGWGGLIFNGVPWIVDDRTFDGPNTSNSAILMLNEDYIHMAVSPRANFFLEPFKSPVDQDVMASNLLWAGNVLVRNPGRQGKMTAVAA
jgi:hypothetical protein